MTITTVLPMATGPTGWINEYLFQDLAATVVALVVFVAMLAYSVKTIRKREYHMRTRITPTVLPTPLPKQRQSRIRRFFTLVRVRAINVGYKVQAIGKEIKGFAQRETLPILTHLSINILIFGLVSWVFFRTMTYYAIRMEDTSGGYFPASEITTILFGVGLGLLVAVQLFIKLQEVFENSRLVQQS